MKNRLGKKLVGIQRKIFMAMVGLFAIVGGSLFFLIMHINKINIYRGMEKQYSYVNENAHTLFASRYKEIDGIADGWILSGAVQKSLLKRPLSRKEKADIEDSMSIFHGGSIDYYLYIDNKFDVFSPKNLSIEPSEFYRLPMTSILKNYGKTCFYWGKDEVFGSGENHLFVLRHVRSVSHDVNAGILCLRMASDFMDKIFKNLNEMDSVQLLYDSSGNLCDVYNPSEYKLTDKRLEWIRGQMGKAETVVPGKGLVCSSKGANTAYSIVTYVPDSVVNSYIYEVYIIFIAAGAVGIVLIVLLSGLASKKLTEPIRKINEYMTCFDDTRLHEYLELNTNTELDTIGHSYNAMIDRVSDLMDKVREDEKMLNEQEIHSLVNQLHPHFLYNTLDTIYMLARISREETIMKMIYALSKYLRINLSKGADEIPISKELEHVCAYMDIQKIRNDNLFDYEVCCDDDVRDIKICKLILQPIAENAVKHGFSEMTEGGHIKIAVRQNKDRLVLTVENNGLPIDKKYLESLNTMESRPVEQLTVNKSSMEGGYGLMNIVARLKLKYGNDIHFYYTTVDTTVCTIELPLDCLRKEAPHEN